MNLFEIDHAIEACVKLSSGDYVDTETGEIIDVAAIGQLEMDRDRKIRNIACWIRNLDSDEKALTEQIKVFAARRDAAKNKKESLKSYLAAFLGGRKWENEEVKVFWRKSETVEVTDAKKISSYYMRFREPEVNKTLLKADIKAGVVIDGAQLVTKNNIQVK